MNAVSNTLVAAQSAHFICSTCNGFVHGLMFFSFGFLMFRIRCCRCVCELVLGQRPPLQFVWVTMGEWRCKFNSCCIEFLFPLRQGKHLDGLIICWRMLCLFLRVSVCSCCVCASVCEERRLVWMEREYDIIWTVCVCVYMCAYIHVYIYNCINIYIYIFLFINIDTYLYIYICTYICIYIYTYIYIHTYIYMYIYIHIYIYVHIHIHIHIPMYIHICIY